MIQSVIKRDGISVVPFDKKKIINAISKANEEVPKWERLSNDNVEQIAYIISSTDRKELGVEDIQNMVENELMKLKKFELARTYMIYRYKRELLRRANTTDESILKLIRDENSEIQRENSNKRASLNSTKRDLIAGEVSKDLTSRLLLPEKIVKAHERGEIHFHDRDYFMMPEFNCCLPNFRDMLENGTTIHGVAIESPKSFRVACNQVTQIMADVASNQYGGQTFYSEVLGKYLSYTREKFRKRITNTVNTTCPGLSEEEKEKLIESMLDEEIKIELKAGIQCIQYQINTLFTTNGQSPFVTIFMYLRKDDPYIEEHAMIIEEIIKQRYDGLKNKDGVYITPTFPKLIYVLTEDNITEDGKYWYLTKLAAKCVARRMVPDFISEKVVKEVYDGNVVGPMGCVNGTSSILLRRKPIGLETYDSVISNWTFKETWDKYAEVCEVKEQINGNRDYLYMDVAHLGLEVFDSKKGFVPVQRLIRNVATKWCHVTLENGRALECTQNHPFDTENRGVVEAKDLRIGIDHITSIRHDNRSQQMECTHSFPKEWSKELSEYCTSVYQRSYAVTSVEMDEYEDYSYDMTTTSEHFEVNGIYSHNCRSFLSPWKDPETGEVKFEGRFNQGVVTLNLPLIAIDAEGDEDKFWELMEERLVLCYEALMCRHKALRGVKSDVSPIHWQDGAIARLKPGEVIDPYLYGGYSTISLGYIGLYECTKYMMGHSHTDEEGREFSLRLMKRLRQATDTWKESTGIGFALYGTPAESACYTLCEKIKKIYGEVEGITEKGYLVNSYHIAPAEPIDAFTKLELESIYQKISSGGTISYIEIPNMQNNIEGILSVIKFIYDHMVYAELNTRSDQCGNCGFEGEIKTNEDGIWQCPKCGCTDTHQLTVTRRTCGYLGTLAGGWNIGKTKEINERVIHLH